MSDLVKNIAALFPGPVNTSRHLYRSGLKVIFPFYHAVSDRKLMHLSKLYGAPTTERFKKDLDYLLGLFTPVKMSDYLNGNFADDHPKPPMVLSFDDGLVQCYDEVLPILIEKGVPATFFINNAFVDNKAMFFRFKANLLIEYMVQVDAGNKERAAEMLHCTKSELAKRLMSVSYVEREITDQVAELWGYSFQEYMRLNPVYLSSIQIIKMLDAGFEIGSHGIDHPLFSLLKTDTTLDHIKKSVEGLSKTYNLKYKYFAFPFTDSGVLDSTIDALFTRNIIDAGFGTAGLKEDKWQAYFQRIPMEMLNKDARATLRSELNRRRIRLMMGKNMTKR